MIDLATKKSVTSNLFVRIHIPYFKETPTSPVVETTWNFSDSLYPAQINGEYYFGLGNLMGITETNSEIKASTSQLTLTISGIPNSSIYQVVNSRIKGCSIIVYRGLFDSSTNTPIEVSEAGNMFARFRGFVNNYSLNEDYNISAKTTTNTIVLTCSSAVEVLNNKIAGRKTNPYSEKKYFPNDLSMDRVPNLENASFNFGAPK